MANGSIAPSCNGHAEPAQNHAIGSAFGESDHDASEQDESEHEEKEQNENERDESEQDQEMRDESEQMKSEGAEAVPHKDEETISRNVGSPDAGLYFSGRRQLPVRTLGIVLESFRALTAVDGQSEGVLREACGKARTRM